MKDGKVRDGCPFSKARYENWGRVRVGVRDLERKEQKEKRGRWRWSTDVEEGGVVWCDGTKKGWTVVVIEVEMTKKTKGEVGREAKFKIKNRKQKG